MFLPCEQAEESRSAGAGNGRFDLPAVLEDGASAGAAAAKKAGFAAEPGSYAVEGDIASAGVSSRELPSDSDAARAKAFVDFQTDVTAKDIRLAVPEGFRPTEHNNRPTTPDMAPQQGKNPHINSLPTTPTP